MSARESAVAPAPAPHVAKDRSCLRCRNGFQSNWSGERICPRCKSSSSWQRGTPRAAPAPKPGRR